MDPRRPPANPPSPGRWLFLTLVLGVFVFSSDIADGDSAGQALIDALITFVIFGSGNVLLVAYLNDWRPRIGWLTPARAWVTLAIAGPVLVFVILAERSGFDFALIVAPATVAVSAAWLVAHHRRQPR